MSAPNGYDPDAILADPNAHPIHKRYAEINIGVRDRGERWSKCVNCGEPFRYDQEPAVSIELCSERCADAYDAYLREGL